MRVLRFLSGLCLTLALPHARLCNVRFTTVRANIDLSAVTVNSRTGDFNPTSLAHVVNTDTVNELIVRTWLDKAGSFSPSPGWHSSQNSTQRTESLH